MNHGKTGLNVRLLEVDRAAPGSRDPVGLFLVVTSKLNPDCDERAWRLPRGVARVNSLVETACGVDVRVEVERLDGEATSQPGPRSLRLCFVSPEGALLSNLRYSDEVDSIYVELEADNPSVRLEAIDDSGKTRVACAAPCRRWLDRRLIYVIQGDGIPPTSRFTLPEDGARVALSVRAGSERWRWTGIAIGALGYAAMNVGIVALQHDDASPKRNLDWRPPSWALPVALGGLAAAAVGGVIVLINARTHVSSSTGRSFSARQRRRGKGPTFALTPRGLEF